MLVVCSIHVSNLHLSRDITIFHLTWLSVAHSSPSAGLRQLKATWCEQTDKQKQTDRETNRHTDHNTSHSYRENFLRCRINVAVIVVWKAKPLWISSPYKCFVDEVEAAFYVRTVGEIADVATVNVPHVFTPPSGSPTYCTLQRHVIRNSTALYTESDSLYYYYYHYYYYYYYYYQYY